jgi:hypothetical protein
VPIFVNRGAPLYDTARYGAISRPRSSHGPASTAESSPHCESADVAIRPISSPRSATSACLPLHVLAQCSIDTCLITLIGRRVTLEPGDHIGVQAERQLLLDGPIEQATLGAGPVEKFRRVRRVDSAIGQGRK